MVLRAPVGVSRDGHGQGVMEPALNLYPAASEPIATPSIRYGALSDLYISVLGFDNQGEKATFRILLNPGVTWLWAGAALMALGAVIAYWPREVRSAQSRSRRVPQLAAAR